MMKISKKWFNYLRDSVRILLIILIFSTISIFWYLNQQRDYYQQYITHSTELRVMTQAITKYAGEAVVGRQESAFRNLKDSYIKTSEELDVLKNGKSFGQKIILPPSPDKIRTEELAKFAETWDILRSKVEVILANQDFIMGLNKTSERLVDNIKRIQDLYLGIVKAWGNSNVEDKKIVSLAYQINSIGGIINDIQNILSITSNNADLKKVFPDKINAFFDNAQVVESENTDPTLVPRFNDVKRYLELVRRDINSVIEISDLSDKIHVTIFDIFNLSSLASNLSKNLENAYISYPKMNTTPEFSAYILGLLSFLVLIFSIYLFHKENESHLKAIEDKNKAMQQEVEKLLKELPEIASGNAGADSVTSSETNNNSSVISESFAYALNTLKKLVYNIGKTAQNVSLSASDAQKITKELATSSGHQAQEIVEVTASVNAMAVSIEQVSANASESAAVALESVNIAGEGGKVVRSTISGMERIQTQIQETSNYMRRLSDSSQEIGEIVSLIDGIADQTNILSLNASIQAAMAGEAGRGFAVVADEVQRLAEKVSYATKEIGSLVRSIQTDTNQVIVAMEQTKAQVLEGVNSAQDAGSTLEKIETVSRRLSDLIQNISLSASEQASVSGKISHIMNDVKDIAKQTASGTMTTVDLIGKLMQFVTDLRNSVFELKLPEDTAGRTRL